MVIFENQDLSHRRVDFWKTTKYNLHIWLEAQAQTLGENWKTVYIELVNHIYDHFAGVIKKIVEQCWCSWSGVIKAIDPSPRAVRCFTVGVHDSSRKAIVGELGEDQSSSFKGRYCDGFDWWRPPTLWCDL